MAAPIVDSILELIGDTPLVELQRVTPSGGARIWAKCEHLNPGGSVKDRICLSMIEHAENSGQLSADQRVVEPTSGNTGIGLAVVCGVKGHPLTLTMPASMSLERRQLLEAYGAEIVLTEPEEAMAGALAAAEEIVATRQAYLPQQFENASNPLAHEETTAQEILAAFDGEPIHALVAAVGTGGTVTGVGRALRKVHPDVHIAAVEPASSPVLAGGKPGPSKIQGLNAGFIPKNYDAATVDEIIAIRDEDAIAMKRKLARAEGLLVGISAGANVAAAVQVADRLPPGHNVVTFLCDTGERYFSLDQYFDDA